MNHVKKTAIRQLVRNFLFEAGPIGSPASNIGYGIYDRPGPSWDEEEEEEITVPSEVPLTPTEMMSNQLVDQRPPVEDDEFVPSNPEELSRAARAISQLVPSSQVDFFYKNLHRLLDKSTERENSPDVTEVEKDDKKEGDVPVKAGKEEKNESLVRSRIRKILEEQPLYGDENPDELSSYRYGDEMPSGYQEEEMGEFEAAAEAAASLPDNTEGMTFEDLADQFGFSGVPGVRQHIDRITSRMQHFVAKTKPQDIATLQDQAVQDFIDLMLSEDYIDDEDAVELQQSPGEVKNLDSFRFFFVSGFVLPAYQQLNRESLKRLKSELDTLGVPEGMRQTVINQVTGKASRDRSAIEKKLSIAAEKSGMSPEQKADLSKKLSTGFSDLVKISELGENMVSIAREKWG